MTDGPYKASAAHFDAPNDKRVHHYCVDGPTTVPGAHVREVDAQNAAESHNRAFAHGVELTRAGNAGTVGQLAVDVSSARVAVAQLLTSPVAAVRALQSTLANANVAIARAVVEPDPFNRGANEYRVQLKRAVPGAPAKRAGGVQEVEGGGENLLHALESALSLADACRWFEGL